MPFRPSRLRQLSRDEISWRAGVFGRTAVRRIALLLHRSRWNRHHLRRALAPHVFDRSMRDEVARGNWQEVDAALTQILLTRQSRFALNPFFAAATRAQILSRWPGAPADATERANRILNGEYDPLGYQGLKFADENRRLDWHLDPTHARRAPRRFWADVRYLDPAIGDHKIIWELNRHQHFLKLGRALWLTGDSRYGTAIVDQVTAWMEENPPFIGINWASMLEIGLRSISWTWALHFLLANHEGQQVRNDSSGPWVADMLLGLHHQLSHVEQNLSYYFSPNTHLTGEALGLYVVGVALPELAHSSRWTDIGRRILLTEIDRQIALDGGHAERSTHYQRYTLDFYLLALRAAVGAGDADAAARFKDAATRLAEFTRDLADDNGRVPLIGDDDGGTLWPLTGRDCDDVRDSLAIAAVMLERPDLAPWGLTEEAAWFGGAGSAGLDLLPIAITPRRPALCRLHGDTGYWVSRDGRGGHLVFDVGAHGYLNGGHAHADALAITLSIGGRRVLIDPGTFTYTMDRRLRDQLRSSMSHNTVTVDGRTQSLPAGPFHWRTQTNAQLGAWRSTGALDWAEASHQGYAPVRHRRSIIRAGEDGWFVVDEILGGGPRVASAHWHFDADWAVSPVTNGCLRITHPDGSLVWLLHEAGDLQLVRGDEESGLGWSAPTYGRLVPSWTARIERHAFAPFSMVTWVGAGTRDGSEPALDRLHVDVDADDAPAIATRISLGSRQSMILVRPDATAPRAGAVGGYQTDARVFRCHTVAERLAALDLVDATHALAIRDGWLSVAADDRIADLHVALADNRLDVRASVPPPVLRLQGGAVDRSRPVLLNGREVPLAAFGHSKTAVLTAAHWGDVGTWQDASDADVSKAVPKTSSAGSTSLSFLTPSGGRMGI